MPVRPATLTTCHKPFRTAALIFCVARFPRHNPPLFLKSDGGVLTEILGALRTVGEMSTHLGSGELSAATPAAWYAGPGWAPTYIDIRHPQAPRASPAPASCSAPRAHRTDGVHRRLVARPAATARYPFHPLAAFRAPWATCEMLSHPATRELRSATPAARHLWPGWPPGALRAHLAHGSSVDARNGDGSHRRQSATGGDRRPLQGARATGSTGHRVAAAGEACYTGPVRGTAEALVKTSVCPVFPRMVSMAGQDSRSSERNEEMKSSQS